MSLFFKSLSILTIGIFISGCGVSSLQTMSLEEAKEHTLKFKTSSYTPPYRTIDDIKAIYTLGTINETNKHINCQERNKLRNIELSESIIQLEKTKDTYSFTDRPLNLASDYFTLGDYLKITNYLKDVEWRIPKSGSAVAKARYNSVLSFLYAEIGEKEESYTRNQIAYNLWTYSGPNMQIKYKAYKQITQASLAKLEGNLIAEEYYLRDVLNTFETEYNTFSHFYKDNFGINKNLIKNKLVENLILQNRFVEAETFARESIQSSYDKFKSNNALLLVSLSKTLFYQNRLEDAKYIALAALELYEKECSFNNGYTVADAKINLIKILLAQENYQEISKIYDKTKKDFINQKEKFYTLYESNKNIILSKILLKQSFKFIPQEKNLIFNDELIELEENSFLALIEMNNKNYKKAFKLFNENFVPLMKKVNIKGVASLELKNRVNIIKSQFIEALIQINKKNIDLGVDIASLLFETIQYNNNSIVENALNASSARIAANDPELEKLIRKEQDTREQLKTLLDKLAFLKSVEKDQKDQKLLQEMESKIKILKSIQNTLQEEIEDNFPKYASLINPKASSIKDIQNILKNKEVMIVIKTNKKGSFIWAIPRKEKAKFHYSQLNDKDIKDIVKELRVALDPSASTLEEIPNFNLKIAHKLYSELLKPIKEGWNDSSHLLFVTSGDLSRLPMGVIPVSDSFENFSKSKLSKTGVDTRGLKSKKAKKLNKLLKNGVLFKEYQNIQWLINNHSITQLPSINSLKSLRDHKIVKKAPKPLIGFADPLFAYNDDGKQNFSDIKSRGLELRRRNTPKILQKEESVDISLLPRLPDTAEEIEAIAKSMNIKSKDSILLQMSATENNVKTKKLKEYNVIVFATHGLIPGDLDGLSQPALALTNPYIEEDYPKENGLLTMGEIFGLNLNADLVLLSACNTATSDGRDNESISGLGQAFFYAGARSLLVTHWPVETISAKLLTTEMFSKRVNNDISKAEALRLSQLDMIKNKGYTLKNGKMLYSYAHPVFWAPFSLVGDR